MRGVRERPIWKVRRWCILCVLKINVVFMVWRQRRRWNRCPSSHLFRGSLARYWISELCSTGWENFARDRIGALGLVSYTFAINDCFVTGENADFRVFPLARPSPSPTAPRHSSRNAPGGARWKPAQRAATSPHYAPQNLRASLPQHFE